MLSKAELEAAVQKHGSEKKAAVALGIPRTTFQTWRKNGVPKDATVSVIRRFIKEGASAKPAPAKAAGRSLADFRAEHDRSYIVPRKIREGLRALSGGWHYEVAFARLAGLGLADLGNFRDEFAAHIVEVRGGRRAWAATPSLAEELRGMVR